MSHETDKAEPSDVEVELVTAPASVSKEDFNAAAKRLGLSTVDVSAMEALVNVGLYVKGRDAIAICNGNALVRGNQIDLWLESLREIRDTAVEDHVKVAATSAASSLIGKHLENDSNRLKILALLMDAVKLEADSAKKRTKSFVPGAIVPAKQEPDAKASTA